MMYYLGTFVIGLPWCLPAFVLGAGIGMYRRDHPSKLAGVAALGFLLCPIIASWCAGAIRWWWSPYGLAWFAVMGFAVMFVFVGDWCGAKIRRPIIRFDETMIRKIIAWLFIAIGSCGTLFGIVGLGIRWRVWGARNVLETGASMVTPVGHFIGFTVVIGIFVAASLAVVAGFRMIKGTSNNSRA